jgi:hypothetical protein
LIDHFEKYVKLAIQYEKDHPTINDNNNDDDDMLFPEDM